MKNIAAGLAGKFVSRNNDIDGYWAMGLLYRFAAENGVQSLSLDLLSGMTERSSHFDKTIAGPFVDFARNQLAKSGLTAEQLTSAVVRLSFNEDAPPALHKHVLTWGEPYSCEVILTDDLGQEWVATRRGWCGQHDPAKERQSTRV